MFFFSFFIVLNDFFCLNDFTKQPDSKSCKIPKKLQTIENVMKMVENKSLFSIRDLSGLKFWVWIRPNLPVCPTLIFIMYGYFITEKASRCGTLRH